MSLVKLILPLLLGKEENEKEVRLLPIHISRNKLPRLVLILFFVLNINSSCRGSDDRTATFLSAKGDSLFKQGALQEAYLVFMELQRHFQLLQNDSGNVMTNNQLAKVRASLRDFDQSRILYNKVLKYGKEVLNRNVIAAVYNDIGCTFFEEGNLDSAFFYFQRTEKMLQDSKNFQLLTRIQLNLGVMMIERGKYEEAIIQTNKALKNNKLQNDTVVALVGPLNIGVSFLEIDNFDSAYFYLNHAEVLSSDLNYPTYLKQAYLNLGHLHYNFDKFEEACDYYESYYQLRDSLYNIQTAIAISKIEQDYALAKEKLSLKEAQLKTLTWQRWAIAIAAMFVVGLVVVFSIYKRRKAIQKARTEAILQTREDESRRITDLLWKEIGFSAKERKLSLPGQELPENTIPGAIAAVRFLSNQQFNPYLQLGLTKAVGNLIDVLSKGKGIIIERRLDDIDLNKQDRLIYYRIIENILVEVFSHLNTTNVKLELKAQSGNLYFLTETDEEMDKNQLRFQSAEARVQQLKGKLKFELADDSSKIKVVIPMAKGN